MVSGADPVAVARTVVDLARDGRFTQIENLFAPRLRAVVSAETLRAGWSIEASRIGEVCAVGEPVREPANSGLVRVSVTVTGGHGGLTVVMSVDETGALHGLRLAAPEAAAWQPPGYADPERFTEHEVTVGSGPRAVPGTVTLPRGGPGLYPGVVLLAGGGPFDRDQTVGPDKPLKDLAWGLASRGVAVARFDKVTHVHGAVSAEPGFTMIDEYVPHALAAVRLLQRQPGVDPQRVYLLGHSAGGRAAPRVAAADASIAGLVILAGDAAPLSRAAVRAARHLARMDPSAAMDAALETLGRQAARVEGPDLAPATPTTDLLFGWPASYWLDLRDYDQVATAVALDKPMLILQGGLDYQVTVEDDLALWQAALAHRPGVTIRIYDADDHMFFSHREDPPARADHAVPRHVDPAVVADIAAWLAPAPGCR